MIIYKNSAGQLFHSDCLFDDEKEQLDVAMDLDDLDIESECQMCGGGLLDDYDDDDKQP